MNEETKKLFLQLYEEIKHGDEEHQQWLKDKIDKFIEEHEKETSSR